MMRWVGSFWPSKVTTTVVSILSTPSTRFLIRRVSTILGLWSCIILPLSNVVAFAKSSSSTSNSMCATPSTSTRRCGIENWTFLIVRVATRSFAACPVLIRIFMRLLDNTTART
uniref:(northern house mosquito) hypothetical protein n=1 Tax=Culex pipiens TaxID=7175 RepID=A0A8D8CUL0_CULPI